MVQEKIYTSLHPKATELVKGLGGKFIPLGGLRVVVYQNVHAGTKSVIGKPVELVLNESESLLLASQILGHIPVSCFERIGKNKAAQEQVRTIAAFVKFWEMQMSKSK